MAGNGKDGGAMLLPNAGTGTQVSVQDLFATIGKKQVLLEIQAAQIDQLGEMNQALQREIILLKKPPAIPKAGIANDKREEESR